MSWTAKVNGAEPTVQLKWEERGGPPVRPPARESFGSLLIRSSLPEALIRFEQEGLTFEIEAIVGEVASRQSTDLLAMAR